MLRHPFVFAVHHHGSWRLATLFFCIKAVRTYNTLTVGTFCALFSTAKHVLSLIQE
jgi:hypothetical protein